ncbi:WD40 repeat-like protein [Cylindrobasidium torrendii FP15055 ss-10]|uniref:WD40 repeat-like protein n=1 Tax=Cylindrobasidium torrendii FP15055 ss-10 TaxID=1314674 RepID=A0A0D7AUX7_9AGAR|nr:WD40 repeat-like protein [Cylindrobasidium torrendii FP15055 ss-10]
MKRGRDDDDEGGRETTRPRFTGSYSSSSTPVRPSPLRGANHATPSSASRSAGYGDRFIPAPAEDMDTRYLLRGSKDMQFRCWGHPVPPDPAKKASDSLFASMLRTESVQDSSPPSQAPGPATPSRRRIFSYFTPNVPPMKMTPTPVRASAVDKENSVSALSRLLLKRHCRPERPNEISRSPYRILDAPGLSSDFYSDLLDISSTGAIAVALKSTVFVCQLDQDGSVKKLCDIHPSTIGSIKWSTRNPSLIAVGSECGHIYIYDLNNPSQAVREYHQAHTKRIGSLSWNGDMIASGSRDEHFHHRDIRMGSSKAIRVRSHTKEVNNAIWSCGDDPALFASAGSDDTVRIWDFRLSVRAQNKRQENELYAFREHKSTIKGLAWSPHVAGVLASGGGLDDRMIRFWCAKKGAGLSKIDTGGQVLKLAWSKTSHEILSTQGLSRNPWMQNTVRIWRYPDLTPVATLVGHTERPSALAMSPVGDVVVTGGADETLRLWDVFPKEPPGRKRVSSCSRVTDFDKLIR